MNKARLESRDNLTIDSEDYRSKLSVFMATRKDTGTYVIKAENASGKDEADVTVTVLGKGEIARQGVRTFTRWGFGRRDKRGRGAFRGRL